MHWLVGRRCCNVLGSWTDTGRWHVCTTSVSASLRAQAKVFSPHTSTLGHCVAMPCSQRMALCPSRVHGRHRWPRHSAGRARRSCAGCLGTACGPSPAPADCTPSLPWPCVCMHKVLPCLLQSVGDAWSRFLVRSKLAAAQKHILKANIVKPARCLPRKDCATVAALLGSIPFNVC